MVRIAQIGLVALLAISVAVLPCPACYAPQTIARQELPASGHECCHKHSAPDSAQSAPDKTPQCGWMPADNGQPEAKTNVAQSVDFHAILGLETAAFSHFPEASRTVVDFLSDSPPTAPPGLAVSLRC